MIYIFVSGGSFGIEEMVSSSGPGLTLILLLAFPFIWALPMALIASELGSAMPHSGGFYVWTRRGLGKFWGFQAAWWWSLALLVDTSLYIVLSATYLQHQIGFSDTMYYAICWSIIALFTAINLMGIRVVAIGSSLFAILIISPIVVLAFVGIANWQLENNLTVVEPPLTLFLHHISALINQTEYADLFLVSRANTGLELSALQTLKSLLNPLILASICIAISCYHQLSGTESDALSDGLSAVLPVHQLTNAEYENIFIFD